MSEVQAVATSTIARYPKRKRAQVVYVEPNFAGEDSDIQIESESENEDATESSRVKKRKSAPSKPLPKRKIFPFLQLPAEIRNEIYSLCLSDPAGICLRSSTKKYRRTVHRVSEAEMDGMHSCQSSSWGYTRTSHIQSSVYVHSSDEESSTSGDGDSGHVNKTPKTPRGPATEIAPLVPSLLAVCKQINQEAGDLLYSHHFYAEDPLTLHSFMVDIGPRVAARLKHIDLMNWVHARGHKSYNHTCFTALMPAINLVSFNTHGFLRCGESAKHIAIQMYRDAFPWLEAVGRAKGRNDAGVDVFNISCVGGYHYRDGAVPDFKPHMRKLLTDRMDRIRS